MTEHGPGPRYMTPYRRDGEAVPRILIRLPRFARAA